MQVMHQHDRPLTPSGGVSWNGLVTSSELRDTAMQRTMPRCSTCGYLLDDTSQAQACPHKRRSPSALVSNSAEGAKHKAIWRLLYGSAHPTFPAPPLLACLGSRCVSRRSGGWQPALSARLWLDSRWPGACRASLLSGAALRGSLLRCVKHACPHSIQVCVRVVSHSSLGDALARLPWCALGRGVRLTRGGLLCQGVGCCALCWGDHSAEVRVRTWGGCGRRPVAEETKISLWPQSFRV
jgi:hypothetical protein